MKNSLLLFSILLLSDACVDRLFFEVDDQSKNETIVEGSISDQQGPYVVRIFKASNVEDNLLNRIPVVAKQVAIFDDLGNKEILANRGSGFFETDPNGIRGIVGRRYHIRIELLDGSVFESIPEELKPVGKVDSVYYEFESFLPRKGQTEYGYRVYMDASNERRNGDHVRWRYTGTYVVETFPERHIRNDACRGFLDPPPCSGYEIIDGSLKRTGDCSCCYCWVQDNEEKPHLSNDDIVSNGQFQKVELGYIPFDVLRFHFKKYMIKVEQMSLTNEAFQYWKIIKDQKEGASSLFQPSFGRVPTNFFSINSSTKISGFFFASSISKKVVFLSGANPRIPYPEFDIPPVESCFYWNSCEKVFGYLNASKTPPPEWE